MGKARELGRQMRRSMVRQVEALDIEAETGQDNEDGTFTLEVEGELNKVYVRLYGKKEQTFPAYNTFQLKSEVPVFVRRDAGGDYVVTRINTRKATERFGEAASQFASTQIFGELSTTVWPSDRLKPGRVRLYEEGTLTVWIEAFHYLHEDAPKFWPGGLLDLTSNIPATANMQRWVKVGVDPATNTAVAEDGDDYPAMLTLPQDLLADILFTDNIPCGGIVLRNGQTAITDFRAFADCRVWIWQTQLGGGGGMTSFALAADTGTPETIGDSNTLTVAGGADIDTSVAPTDTVTVAAGPRLSAAASLFLYDTYFNFS